MYTQSLCRVDFVKPKNQDCEATRVVPRIIIHGMSQCPKTVFKDIVIDRRTPSFSNYPLLCDLDTAAPIDTILPDKFFDSPDYLEGTYRPAMKALYMPFSRTAINDSEFKVNNENNIFQNNQYKELGERFAKEILKNIKTQQTPENTARNDVPQQINVSAEDLLKTLITLVSLLNDKDFGKISETDDNEITVPPSTKTDRADKTSTPGVVIELHPAKNNDDTANSNVSDKYQQQLCNDLKRLIDGKTEAGLSTKASKDSRVKDIFSVLKELNADTLKNFFKENPEYVDKLYGQFTNHGVDEIIHQISKKLVEARREAKGFSNLREINDNAEKYADEVYKLDFDTATPQYLSELADHVATSGRGGRVLQEINDFWFDSNTKKASINLIKLLAMAD